MMLQLFLWIVAINAEEAAQGCAGWCAKAAKPWKTKCGWGGCSKCTDCDAFKKGPRCGDWCATSKEPWKKRCKHDDCKGCTNCVARCEEQCGSDEETPWASKCLKPSCKTCDECRDMTCQYWCRTESPDWFVQCTWPGCAECTECKNTQAPHMEAEYDSPYKNDPEVQLIKSWVDEDSSLEKKFENFWLIHLNCWVWSDRYKDAQLTCKNRYPKWPTGQKLCLNKEKTTYMDDKNRKHNCKAITWKKAQRDCAWCDQLSTCKKFCAGAHADPAKCLSRDKDLESITTPVQKYCYYHAKAKDLSGLRPVKCVPCRDEGKGVNSGWKKACKKFYDKVGDCTHFTDEERLQTRPEDDEEKENRKMAQYCSQCGSCKTDPNHPEFCPLTDPKAVARGSFKAKLGNMIYWRDEDIPMIPDQYKVESNRNLEQEYCATQVDLISGDNCCKCLAECNSDHDDNMGYCTNPDIDQRCCESLTEKIEPWQCSDWYTWYCESRRNLENKRLLAF